jgi:nitronate monooxygenase
MALPPLLRNLRLPVIGAPLFIISDPDLVIAQCKAGVVGSFPALNARPAAQLDEWLRRIKGELAEYDAKHPDAPSAPFAVNQIVHRTNERLMHDLAVCETHEVKLLITSLGAREDVNHAAHGWGAIVLHDVISAAFARKALDKGADGLIAVAAGAGGHAGTQSPFALVAEIRSFFQGPLALSGAIATGDAVLAAQAMGADLAYIGSAFIATEEARAQADHKRMIVEGDAADLVYTDFFSGANANFLKASVARAGYEPDALPTGPRPRLDVGEGEAKVWRDLWSAGQGIGSISEVVPVAGLVARLGREYRAARERLGLAT